MYKIIEQLCVTTREENGHGYVIAHEKTHTKAYQTQLQKSKDFGGKTANTFVIDNKPTSGFSVNKIYQDTRTHYWYSYFGSSTTVVFVISDPRGFKQEIYQEAFAAMLQDVTIVNGEIQGECYWSKNGGKWVLIPVGSKIDSEHAREKVVHETTKMTKKDILENIEVGARIKVKYLNEVIELYYMGFHKVLQTNTKCIDVGYDKIELTTVKTPKLVDRMFYCDTTEAAYPRDDSNGYYYGSSSTTYVVGGMKVKYVSTPFEVIGYDNSDKCKITDQFIEKLSNTTLLDNQYKRLMLGWGSSDSVVATKEKITKVESFNLLFKQCELSDVILGLSKKYEGRNVVPRTNKFTVKENKTYYLDDYSTVTIAVYDNTSNSDIALIVNCDYRVMRDVYNSERAIRNLPDNTLTLNTLHNRNENNDVVLNVSNDSDTISIAERKVYEWYGHYGREKASSHINDAKFNDVFQRIKVFFDRTYENCNTTVNRASRAFNSNNCHTLQYVLNGNVIEI